MTTTSKRRGTVLVILVCLLLFSLTLLGVTANTATASAEEKWTYINDLAGNFTIQSVDANHSGKEFDVYGGKTSTNDSSTAPYIILTGASSTPQANHRFTFMPIEMVSGRMVYYITSVIDNNGRLDVKGGNFAANQPIWFWNQNGSSKDNNAQRWFVKTCDDGQTVQIELAYDTKYAMGIGTAKKDTYTVVCLSTDKGTNKTRWKLAPVVGDFGVNTSTYIMADNTDYAGMTSANEHWRYLDPLDTSENSRISDIISIGVHGKGVEQTSYNGVQAFSVPYSSRVYLDTGFNYANSTYSQWERNLALGKMANSGGKVLNWMVSSDSATMQTSDGEKHTIGTGSVLIELSTDNSVWTKYRMFPFASNQKSDVWEINGSLLSSGRYVRVSYLFEIYTHWTTYEREWYNYLLFGIPIGGHDVDHYEYKNVREVSDTFYIAVDGFSEGDDFGVISVKNMSKTDISAYNVEGFTCDELHKAETLTDGAQTNSGFKIESIYPSGTYKIEVAKNGGQFSAVSSGYSTTADGRYQIRATSKFGKQKTITVYVCCGDVTNAYLGAPFASKPNETALVQGTRFFAGLNDYLKGIGINPTYSWAQVPVYLKGASINIKDTTNLASIKGTINYAGSDGEGEIAVTPQNGKVKIVLNHAGYYNVNLSTVNEVGDISQFSAKFWVVENAIGPEINKQLLSLTHEIYDLIPVFYSVDMERGPYTYIDDKGNETEKLGVLRYAFASYDSALAFSLRIQKEYAYRLDNGYFRYLKSTSPNMYLTEYELFEEMYRNAKAAVKTNYFSTSNSLSMAGTDTKGIISERGFVYYLGEETFDGNAKNAAPVVALNKAERDALTARRGFLNNFTFVSVALDSASVKLVSPEGIEYNIAYDIPVGQQLKKLNAKSSVYTVIETSVYGVETRYDAVYVNEDEDNSISINLTFANGGTRRITAADDGCLLTCSSGFSIESAIDELDSHGLIVVSYGRMELPLDIANANGASYCETGIYQFKVEDRFGRFYQFTITVA